MSESVGKIINPHEVETLRGDEVLLDQVARKSYDLILLQDEGDTLASIKAIDPRVEVILFGHEEEKMLEAIRRGAYAYFLYPIDNQRLREAVDSIDDMTVLRRRNARLEQQLSTNYTFFNEVVGKNPRMLEIFGVLKRIAPYYKTLTLMGETGSGKEVMAKTLHSLSCGTRNPFTVCDCGSLVETLVESELFGHKKGSFTGAIADKMGLFEAAGEGTIFLDEIGELPLKSQASLLRTLQSNEFRKVGSERTLKAKCRIIAATNKNLQREVKKGTFREDLFYRITQFTMDLPPLRERKDDIPLLCRHFLQRFSEGTGKRVLGISRPAQILLMSHTWPGNVRELENVLERAAILSAESFIRMDDLPEYLKKLSKEKTESPDTLDDAIRKCIEEALLRNGNNRTKAAMTLGISRRSLLRKMEKYAMKPPVMP